MNSELAALQYLIGRTTRNRLKAQARKIRSPRHAAILLVVVGYFSLVMLTPGTMAKAGITGFSAVMQLLFTLMIGLLLAGTWWGKSGERALAFQPAEVNFLFTAPLSRRELLGYRIARGQIALLFNALLWTVLLRRFGVTLPALERFFGAWSFFSLLYLNPLLVALIRMRPVHGVRLAILGLGRAWSIGTVAAVLVSAINGIRTWNTMPSPNPFAHLVAIADSVPGTYALAPFRFLLGVVGAQGTAWTTAFAVVAGLVLVHVLVILSLNVPFEETAVESSRRVAKTLASVRAGRFSGSPRIKEGKKARAFIKLAPHGHPATAIVWKNSIAFIRGTNIRTVLMLIVYAFVFSHLGGSGREGKQMGVIFIASYIPVIAIFGARFIRNDLRMDLLSLPALKTLPLDGYALILAEIASPVMILAVIQVLLVGYSVMNISADQLHMSAGTIMALTPIALLFLAAFNVINLLIANGAALMFPTWMRLGPTAGGVEMMGQSLVVALISSLALLVLLIVPAIIGACFFFLAKLALSATLPVCGALAAVGVTAMIAGEAALMLRSLGRRFDALEPAAMT